jgi:hypothetical protein
MKQDLKELFLSLQTQLSSTLEVNRQVIPHAPTKGSASEADWLKMLDKYLPSRYQAKKAFVLDIDGNLSEQIDVVIFDRHYCPLFFHHEEAAYVPAESVYAVFEVKQTLNKGHIEYAGQKVASVRKLRRTSTNIPYAGGFYPPKTPFRILSGILTLDSDWSPGLGMPLIDVLGSLTQDQQLDLGCSLRCGSFEATYAIGQPPELDISYQETALVFFFMRLLHRLQQFGTVPAIDLREYSKSLERT